MPRTSNLPSFYLGPDVQVGGRQGLSACVEQVPAHHWVQYFVSGLHQRASAECVQYRRRRSTDGAAVLAHDSDGSPPGCLSIGSTGQEVIHVYERRHNAA